MLCFETQADRVYAVFGYESWSRYMLCFETQADKVYVVTDHEAKCRWMHRLIMCNAVCGCTD